MKNRILAIEAAPAAIPPKPNIAATIATIRNTTVQRNIVKSLVGLSITQKYRLSITRLNILKNLCRKKYRRKKNKLGNYFTKKATLLPRLGLKTPQSAFYILLPASLIKAASMVYLQLT